jgi:type I restriction-modification system DNA methylase subunit
MMKTAFWGLGILLILPVGAVAAQSQAAPQDMSPSSASSSSLAEAARRTREAKKDQNTPPRVWNNDTIPKAGDEISVVGPSSSANSNGAGATADSSANAGANNAAAKAEGAGTPNSQSRSALDSQLTNAKEKLATIKTDLDILQRTYTLDSQMYYGKPDYSTDKEGAAKLKDEQVQIDAKQQEMDDQQKKIDELEAEQAKLGPANGPEPPADNEESK